MGKLFHCWKTRISIAIALLHAFSVGNLYAKPGALPAVARNLSEVTAQGTSRQIKKPSRVKIVLPPPTDLLEKTLSFRGWMGEQAVLRQESLFDNGSMSTSFFLLTPNTRWIQLRLNGQSEDDHNDPPGMQVGRVLISDYSIESGHPRISFQMDADPKQISALQESVSNNEQPTRAVRAVLTIRAESRSGRRVILWKQSRQVTTTPGESGMIYRPPVLRSAILSPKETALLVELIVGEAAEYFVISMKPAR